MSQILNSQQAEEKACQMMGLSDKYSAFHEEAKVQETTTDVPKVNSNPDNREARVYGHFRLVSEW